MSNVRRYVLSKHGDRYVTKDHREAELLVNVYGWTVVKVDVYPE